MPSIFFASHCTFGRQEIFGMRLILMMPKIRALFECCKTTIKQQN